MTTAEIIDTHRSAGRPFTAAGVRSFVREEGTGDAVLCSHGMWGSSFLYRKVIHELSARGLRGIAWDLPGFGLAERPKDYDYSWTGLGRFAAAAADALQLDRFHLIVHDIGGPVGFELASAHPERIASITILNSGYLWNGNSPLALVEPRPGIQLVIRALARLQLVVAGLPIAHLDWQAEHSF